MRAWWIAISGSKATRTQPQAGHRGHYTSDRRKAGPGIAQVSDDKSGPNQSCFLGLNWELQREKGAGDRFQPPFLSQPNPTNPSPFSAELTIRAAISSRPRLTSTIHSLQRHLFDEVASLPTSRVQDTYPTQPSQDKKTLRHNGCPRTRADSLRGRLGANLQNPEALPGAS